MAGSREQTFRSAIATPPIDGATQSGKGYINFDIESGKSKTLKPCTAWDSMIGACDKQSLLDAKVGDIITVRGFEGDSGAFVVKWFKVEDSSPESIERSESQRIMDYCGGEKRYRERQKEHFAEMEAKGMVLCFDDDDKLFFDKKERCHKTGKFYRRKIDFCMDVLGAARVNKKIQEVMPGGKLSATQLTLGGFPLAAYKELLNKMYQEALAVDSEGGYAD